MRPLATMDEETYLRQRLADLHREYLERSRPIMKRLAELQALKPPPPIIIPAGWLDADGATPCWRGITDEAE